MTERYRIITAVYLILKDSENKILFQRRFNTGYRDGEYGLVSGHMEESETVLSALKRETKEEIGIEINSLTLVHVMHRRKETPDSHDRLDFFFNADSWCGTIQILEMNKHDKLDWFPMENLPENVIPYIRIALEAIGNNIFYSEYGWK